MGPRTKAAPTLPADHVDQAQVPIQGSYAVTGDGGVLSAISQQSLAITQLVAHLAGGGPIADLAGSPAVAGLGLSSKGVACRERMQSELAQRTSSYFIQVQQQLFKRMNLQKSWHKRISL